MKKLIKKINRQYSKFNTDLKDVSKQQKKLHKSLLSYERKLEQLKVQLAKTEIFFDQQIGAAAGADDQDQLLNATKQMQETQMSFNLQYLQLQSQTQLYSRK